MHIPTDMVKPGDQILVSTNERSELVRVTVKAITEESKFTRSFECESDHPLMSPSCQLYALRSQTVQLAEPVQGAEQTPAQPSITLECVSCGAPNTSHGLCSACIALCHCDEDETEELYLDDEDDFCDHEDLK